MIVHPGCLQPVPAPLVAGLDCKQTRRTASSSSVVIPPSWTVRYCLYACARVCMRVCICACLGCTFVVRAFTSVLCP